MLFTGAGFSLAAKNIEGRTVPGYDDLCREIWSISFPNEEYEEGSSLRDLFEDARLRHASKLKSRLTTLLSVDSKDLPEFFGLIYSMPWSRCYTLNIDNLDEVVARKFELPRRLTPVSAVTSTSPSAAQPLLQNIHLNGTLADLPNDVTFSELQYSQRLANPDRYYLQLVVDIISRPIVFIGTSLDEPPIWQHLELRKSKGGRRERELRPRSYLVTPTLPRPRRALLAEFNTVWLQMTAEEFSEAIIAKLQASAKKGLSVLKSAFEGSHPRSTDLPIVSEIASHPLVKTDYLIGQEPTWSDIKSGRAVERDCDDQLNKTVEARLSNEEIRGLVVVTGTAGSGKSTTLMRAALKLSAEGRKVAWVDREIEISPREISAGMRAEDGPEILAIDNADQYGSQVSSLAREISLFETRPLILLEVRSGRMDRIIIPSQLAGIPVADVNMTHLTDLDIDALIGTLDKENRLGILKGKSRTEQVQAFQKQAGRQLLVAMYQATSGRKFEEKVAEELLELDGEMQFVYGLVSVATAHRFGLTKDEIVIATGDRSNVTLNVIERLLNQHLVVYSRDQTQLFVRHRVIAAILSDVLKERGSVKEMLYGLILAGATKYAPGMQRSSKSYRIVQTFINHDLLFRMLDYEQARSLYGDVEQLLHRDSHYWLQRGSLEVEEGSLGLAENFLSQSRSLTPDNPFIDNEWAYLLFKKAIETPGSSRASALVEEAMEILNRLIEGDRARDPYPYHVLGSQGLSWTRRGIRDDEKKAIFLRKLIFAVRSGIKKFPESKVLRQLATDLDKESLSLAVPFHLRQ